MIRIQTDVPRKAMIALTACRRRVVPVGIPIWEKICGEKYLFTESARNAHQSGKEHDPTEQTARPEEYLLDRTHSSHLTTRLDHHDENRAPKIRPPLEQIEICLRFLRMLFRDLLLDQIKLRNDVQVIDIAV